MKRTVIILSISSDIGLFLARQYLNRGDRVIGTYRTQKSLGDFGASEQCSLFRCDIAKRADVDAFAAEIKRRNIVWDCLISCVGHPLPVLPFFQCDFDEWAASVQVNSIAQLRVLHALRPAMKKNATVVFFAGGGMNGAVKNFSAYTVSKVMLAKMCEFIDAENPGLNIFIVGPGWTKTKIHTTILSDTRTAKAKVLETRAFLRKKEGTPLQDIFECIEWLAGSGKRLASGRNFSVVYDPWRKPLREKLVKALGNSQDMYKLRRQGNDF